MSATPGNEKIKQKKAFDRSRHTVVRGQGSNAFVLGLSASPLKWKARCYVYCKSCASWSRSLGQN
ncbi:hypothetical protein [Polaromonas sp. CG9_12]|nr:hypothetical protein [Polaromonas sp. CG9_12]